MAEGLKHPPKPANFCYYCHSPFEYEWYEFEAGSMTEGEPEGFWMELPCVECQMRRKALAEELVSLHTAGALELNAGDRALIKEAGIDLKES